jgi:arabinofuranosyltransferase
VDELGLNDQVIAHTPARRAGQFNRAMAHDRQAPKGYVECFRPNVRVSDGHAAVRARNVPLTPAEVKSCEERYLAEALR